MRTRFISNSPLSFKKEPIISCPVSNRNTTKHFEDILLQKDFEHLYFHHYEDLFYNAGDPLEYEEYIKTI